MRTVHHRRESEACAALTSERRSAWVRVLSAIQTSETMECQVLKPLIETIDDEASLTLLKEQSRDEERHAEHVKKYLAAHFGYLKRRATFSDQLFYSMILPLLRRFVSKRARYGLAVLLFYERFSIGLYAQLIKSARQNELFDLVAIFEEILRDESKHIRGLKSLLKQEQYASGGSQRMLDYMLRFIAKDLGFEPWALHSREIRRQLEILSIDPDQINDRRRIALNKVASDCVISA